MLFPLYLSSTRLFSFPPTIYLSSCTVPLFSFLTSSSFPLLHPLHPTLFLISLDPAPPSLSFSIFSSSYSYSTLPLTSLMSTVYFHHLASSLSLPPCLPRPLFIVLHVQLYSRKEEREEEEGGKNVVHSSTSSKFHESTCFASGTSLRVHLMHPRERCHFGIFVFHLLPSPFDSRQISIRDPSHFFVRPFPLIGSHAR